MAERTEASRTAAGSSRWVTLSRACEILGVDESTLRRWADTGRLRVYRTPGGHRRFSLVNLEEMVAGENRHSSGEEIERLAVVRIRRQLQRARQQDGRAIRLIGVGLSNFVEDVTQLSLETSVDEKQEKLSAAFDKMRTKYGARSLQTGRTAFRGVAEDDDRLLERQTGLYSPIH